MQPILFSIAGIHIFSLSVFLVLAWCSFSFLFWRSLRNQAVSDEHIFDLTFYATLSVLIGSRIAFVVFHKELFSDTLLKIPALWVQPGLSLFGGLIFGMLTFLYLARRNKVRVAYILDSLAFALPVSFIIGLIGSFLDGSVIGKLTDYPWGVPYIGAVGKRHPVQIYEIAILLISLMFLTFIHKKAMKKGSPYGSTGLWFFLFFSISMFIVEFFTDSGIYFSYLSANQWICIGFFAETLGAFYVRGGGREALRPYISKSREIAVSKAQTIYAKFSKRSA